MFAFAVADGVQGLYLGRFLQGLGAALMWVFARTIVADTTPVQNYGEAMGQLTAISPRGSMIGGFYGRLLCSFRGRLGGGRSGLGRSCRGPQ
jgi:MFS family permease